MGEIRCEMQTTVNRIYIICSASTSNTARRLNEDLLPQSIAATMPDVAKVYLVKSLNDINAAFRAIRKDCEAEKIKPLIHFDFHASELHGLLISPRHYVSWEWICWRCREINAVCGNLLGVVMACCYGLNAIRGVSINKLVPFQYLIGSQEIVYEGPDIDEVFVDFYVELFASGSFESALLKLPKKFKPFYAEKMFVIVLAKYLKGGTYGKGLQARKEKLVTELVQAGLYPTPENLRMWRAAIVERFSLNEAYVQQIIENYSATFLGGASHIKPADLFQLLDK